MAKKNQKLPKIGMLYLDFVLRFFDKSNFRGWPDKIETVLTIGKMIKIDLSKRLREKRLIF